MSKSIKRAVKDSIFTDMFNRPKYTLDLYKSLHPEDSDVSVHDIKNLTLKTILTDGQYNDLGFFVKNKLIILVEAQSTWSVNILWRHLIYLADTYKNYFHDTKASLYSSTRVTAPYPELYVIYTGGDKVPAQISLQEEFFGKPCQLEMKINVITNHKEYDIINQYIRFAHKVDVYKKKPGDRHKLAIQLVDECIAEGILTEYLKENRKEIIAMIDILFDDEIIQENYRLQLETMAEERGRAQGKKEEAYDLLNDLVAKGIITKEVAEQMLKERIK